MYTVYTGGQARLRPFRDADELLECAADNQQASFAHWGPTHLDVAAERRRFADDGMLPVPGCGQFAIELRDGPVAGTSHYQLNRGGMVAGVGTFVREEYRHRRIGVEARRLVLCFIFDNLSVSRIEAVTLSSNIAALTSLERSGMEREGEQRGMRFSNGKWESYVFFSIFREQWEQMDYLHTVQRGVQ